MYGKQSLSVFIVNDKLISHIILVFSWLTLKINAGWVYIPVFSLSARILNLDKITSRDLF